MSDNPSKFELSLIESEILGNNIVRFNSTFVIELVPAFENLPVINIPKRKRVTKWTLPLFIEHAQALHGLKFDYSQIKDYHIKGSNSHIPIKCNICTYEWERFLFVHMSGKGCPDCAGNAPWTLKRFLLRAVQIHGDKFNYSKIIESDIVNINSYITIICNICDYEWSTSTIHGHVNDKTGCPDCSGKILWTLERFLIRAVQIHGNKFDYSKILKIHIKGTRSHIPIKCNICTYEWSTSTIGGHINGKTGCPDCSGHVAWTLERFLIRAKQIHGNNFDYSQAVESHFIDVGSRIPMKCNICDYECSPTIHLHINGKYGCADCAGHAPWTLIRFLKRAKQIHGEKRYDYSYILDEHIVDGNSLIPIKCIKCNTFSLPPITGHINRKTGCSKCRFSKGEIKCSEVLNSFNIPYECQYIIPSLPSRRYDFMFIFNNKNYILEYDGSQHFNEVVFFGNKLKQIQTSDLLKTKAALVEGYLMIRIDSTQINHIQYHIRKAIEENNSIYFSNIVFIHTR